MMSHLLKDALPEFALELEELLHSSGEPQLAEQISSLQVIRRCDCEDDFCSSFYTQYEPSVRPYPNAHCVELESKKGMIILDVVVGEIAHVEVLFRDDVREKIRALFP
jgi:hypothetical protein